MNIIFFSRIFVLATNKSTRNICNNVFVWARFFFFPFSDYLGVEWLDHVVSLYLTLYEAAGGGCYGTMGSAAFEDAHIPYQSASFESRLLIPSLHFG